VRAAAASVQRAAQPQERLSRLAPLLSDPLASVRIAAAREFLSLPIARLPGDMNDALQAAMGEWQSSMRAKSDFPETQLVMGGIGLTTRNFDNALRAFDEAVEMDPNLVQAWFMGVRIRAALGDMDAARAHLERALAVNPGVQALLELQSQIP
jgi:tetratricopeptide (TPR) repeat protein